MKICKKCIMHTDIKGVILDDNGICNYCHWDTQMNKDHPISNHYLNKIVKEIKEQGKGKRYDAIIGLSGGTDSSYLLKLMVEKGLRLLGVHWDNNWNTKTAWSNIFTVTEHFGVDLRVRRINHMVYDHLCKSFLLASTPDADIPNDIALTTVLYEEAENENVKAIINGHSFRTEGTCPTGWTYMDGKYIESVNSEFLRSNLSTFPNLTIQKWLKWLPIKRYRPFYYIDYRKDVAQNELADIGWVDYGGHHAENRYTKFIGNYMWRYKFKQDIRYVSLSAQIRNHHIFREDALKIVEEPLVCENDILCEVKDRLDFTDDSFEEMMKLPVKNHMFYKTYDFSNLGQIFDEYREYLPRTFIDKYVDRVI